MDPIKLTDKTLQSANLPGQDVVISTVQIQMNPIVYEVTATIGIHSYVERHTIGAREGGVDTGPLMTIDELQTKLDSYRQAVADAAAWQVAMTQLGGPAAIANQVK